MANREEKEKRALDTLEYTMGFDVMQYMKDPDISEVIINFDEKIWVDSFTKGHYYTGKTLPRDMTRQIIYQVADMKDKVCTEKSPMLEAELPDGSRFMGFIPDVVPAPSIIIRKHAILNMTLDKYVEAGTMTAAQRATILKAIKDHKSIIAAGGTNTGKTTFLNAILAEICKMQERVVLVEDTPELQCTAEDYLPLRTSDFIGMAGLLRGTLRSSPKRIVVGEVRGEEALSLLDAWSTGHGGGCSTVHSNSAVQTLKRLENMVSRVSLTPQQQTIAEAVDIIVYLRMKGMRRYVDEIIGVDGYDEVKHCYITHEIL